MNFSHWVMIPFLRCFFDLTAGRAEHVVPFNVYPIFFWHFKGNKNSYNRYNPINLINFIANCFFWACFPSLYGSVFHPRKSWIPPTRWASSVRCPQKSCAWALQKSMTAWWGRRLDGDPREPVGWHQVMKFSNTEEPHWNSDLVVK